MEDNSALHSVEKSRVINTFKVHYSKLWQWDSSPALDVLLQRHHHGQVLVHVGLAGRLALPPQGVVEQLQLRLPGQDVGVAVVEAQWDLSTGVGAAVAADHSDLWQGVKSGLRYEWAEVLE